MNKKQLDFILQEGEGLKIEFKESFDKSLAKEMVAFANSSGGRLFLGIDDSNEITGVNITNRLKSQIQDVANNCDPRIRIDFDSVKLGRKRMLVIVVPEGDNKPYQCSTGFYLRQGSNSQKLTRDEIIDFSIGEGRIRFDSQINEKFNFEEDFDEAKLDEYLKLANLKKDMGVEDILINLGVAVKKDGKVQFNNTGVLFFAKNPEKFFLTSKVICANYQTNEKVKILDRKIFDEGIMRNLKEAIGYVKKHIDVEFVIKKLEREEIPQYPEEAVRECIINAVMHRDYFDDAEDILIETFRNKYAVSNPGGLVKGLKPEDFGTKSRTRNPLLANLLLRTEYVERMGTGINRIREAMRKAGLLEPEFKFDTSFSVTLYDKTYLRYPEKYPEKYPERLNPTQLKILELIKQDSTITRKELAERVELSDAAIKKNVAKLKKLGLLERVGPAKGGHWRIKKG